MVNDLDSEEVKGIELRGMRKSWKGEGGLSATIRSLHLRGKGSYRNLIQFIFVSDHMKNNKMAN